MFFSSLSWLVFTFALLFALPSALATPSPKRSKKSATTRTTTEIYPAMEDEGITPRIQTLGASAESHTQKFEFVPTEKRPQILKRIRICQSLFEETGRAYDYRSMTTTELEKELAAVRAEKNIESNIDK